LWRYRNFCDFQDGGRRHVGFSISRNFNAQSVVWGRCASPCQISSKTLKRLQRYGNLTVFKMAAVRHLVFVKFEFLTAGAVKRQILYQRTKFREDRSNRCEDIAIFVIFQDGGRRHVGFVGRLLEPPTTTSWWSLSCKIWLKSMQQFR